jgi:hypothetical protein
MAKGRIIVSAITCDKCVNNLSDDTSRLAFTWLVTFADREGRTYGDPAVVRSMLFPRREDVSIAQMERYITEWAACGLIVWYEADGDLWIAFPSFFKHQTGFDKRHEPASTVPVPPDRQRTERTPDIAGTVYVQGTSEVKRSEEKLLRSANANDNEEPTSSGAIAPDAIHTGSTAGGNGNGIQDVVAKKERKPRKPTVRSEIENAMMTEFLRSTGYAMPQRIQAVNWWYSELREIAPMVDNDVGRAVTLIGDTVREMQHTRVNNEPLRIGDPKSIIKVARSLAAKKTQGVQL